jgi:polyhydroxyalkanoate synthesis regulator phasin
MTNQELMERAAITTAQLVNAGKLNPEQANKFIDYIVDESVLKDIGRIERFRPEEKVIDKIGVGNRVAVRKAEAADPMIRRLVTTSKVTLKPEDIMVPFEIGDRFGRHNIEGDDVEDHIIRMMAEQLANNLDELWLGGLTKMAARPESDIFDNASSTDYIGDDYLSSFSGFLQQAEAGHVVDAENAAIGAAIFNKALLAMPTKFRRNRNMIKFMLSPDHEQSYRESLSQRATPVGDNALQSQLNLTPFGVELMPVPLMERNPLYAEDSVANTDGTTATSLSFKPITSLVLTDTTLPIMPGSGITPYVLSTDYNQSLTNGTWTRLAAAGIGSGATVRATYRTAGKMILTNPKNLILAIGLDIRIERDRNIYKTVNEYAITVSVDCKFENTDAVVLVKNIADPTL